MAKIVSSYCTKVIGENRIFKDTIRVYRDALSPVSYTHLTLPTTPEV